MLFCTKTRLSAYYCLVLIFRMEEFWIWFLSSLTKSVELFKHAPNEVEDAAHNLLSAR